MKCPFCGYAESKVTDSREAVDQNAVKRRRQCLGCFKRFTTFEAVDLTIQVYKRNGCYEEFQQNKLIKGLDAACNHTRVSHEQVVLIASEITANLMARQVREISTKEIGEMAMQKLKNIDPIAYIRFACVYRRFKDMDELVGAIQDVTHIQHKQESEDCYGIVSERDRGIQEKVNSHEEWNN